MAEYQLIVSGQLKENFKKLCEKAREEGRLSSARSAAKEIMALLQKSAPSLGELLYHLKHSGWPIHHVVHRPWSIHFAVDEQRHLVFLTRIELLS